MRRLLLPASLLALLQLHWVANAGAEGLEKIEFAVEKEQVHITYDLEGKGAYEVELRLSLDGGETFAQRPIALSGAVGPGVTPGRGKLIVWDLLKDNPDGLEGTAFAFQVRAVRPGDTNKWALLGLAAGAGTAGIVALSGGGSGGDPGGGPSGPAQEDDGTIIIDIADPVE